MNRYPSGDIKRDEISLVARLANARIQVLKDLGEQNLSTELGRLHIRGKIVETQRLAGERYAELNDDYHRIVLDGLSGRPVMGSLERRSRGSGTREYETDTVKKVRERFDQLRNSIRSLKDGKKILMAVDHLCIEDRMLSYSDLKLCKQGLDRIALFLDLAGVVKRLTRA